MFPTVGPISIHTPKALELRERESKREPLYNRIDRAKERVVTMLVPILSMAGRSPVSPITPISEEDPMDLALEDQPAAPTPVHPISQLQGPFEESILEATHGSVSHWVVNIDAQSRRRDLLENDEYERLCGRKWRQRATER